MDDWLVDVPPYNKDGVKIERFTIPQDAEDFDRLRAQLNPQRSDRSVRAGTYTRLYVDGDLWMTDTPAECKDLLEVDNIMSGFPHGSALIVGLGLGVIVNRAIKVHGLEWIDVVERDQRVIDAVGEHYRQMAVDRGIILNIHHADIHKWRANQWVGSVYRTHPTWDVGFFDIWPTIDMEDRAEVQRLRRRFKPRLGWFGAWAQDERNAQAKRIRNKTGFY